MLDGPSYNTWLFDEDSLKWRGIVLHGLFAHWCYEWDGLPTDETCTEFACCTCYSPDEIAAFRTAVLEVSK